MTFKEPEGQKEGVKNDEVTSNFYDFASRGFTKTIRSICLFFLKKHT